MYAEDEHVAHPRLVGAPAYARPPLAVMPAERPFDPDDLPIAAEQTAEERAISELSLTRPYLVGQATVERPDAGLRPRPVRLGAIAGRILGRSS